jgi:CheY-like chemotaxis protein
MGPNGAISLDGIRVLVVDGDADEREMYALTFQQYGAIVSVADSAKRALSTLEDENPDVLVIELCLPEVDGFSLIRRVRALASNHVAHIPAVAVSALVDPEHSGRAIDAGYQVCLPKPVTQETLMAVVASLAQTWHGAAHEALI